MSDWRGRRVLVTGANGFVGLHLLRRLLAEGADVTGTYVTEPPSSINSSAGGQTGRVDWRPLDVRSGAEIERVVGVCQPEFVFHLAAQSSVGGSFRMPELTWDVNATGTWRLLHALRDTGARVLLASSAEVYGAVPEAEHPIREDRALRPANPYAAAKAAAEMAAIEACLAHGLTVVVARSFNHTGPGQDTRFALPSFAAQLQAMQAGSDRVLRVGNLTACRDLLDVRDVVEAYLLLARRGAPGCDTAYNVCSGTAQSMYEVVERMVAVSGIDARIEVDPERVRPVDVPLLLGDNTRLCELGWQPTIGLEQTLRDLLDGVTVQGLP
jgi:GDP-4-dehydro-6-deoxy-D-mannose reductase